LPLRRKERIIHLAGLSNGVSFGPVEPDVVQPAEIFAARQHLLVVDGGSRKLETDRPCEMPHTFAPAQISRTVSRMELSTRNNAVAAHGSSPTMASLLVPR